MPKKIEYIYEKIAPSECLLLYKQGETIVYATNIQGKIEIKKAELEEEKARVK